MTDSAVERLVALIPYRAGVQCRVRNALHVLKVKTEDDLRALTRDNLRPLKNFGQHSQSALLRASAQMFSVVAPDDTEAFVSVWLSKKHGVMPNPFGEHFIRWCKGCHENPIPQTRRRRLPRRFCSTRCHNRVAAMRFRCRRRGVPVKRQHDVSSGVVTYTCACGTATLHVHGSRHWGEGLNHIPPQSLKCLVEAAGLA